MTTPTSSHAGYAAARSYAFADLLREQARSRPHNVALVDGAHRITYAQMQERVCRLANGLRAAGIGSGARLLWLGQNSFRVLELLAASAQLGAVLCPVNWRMSASEVRRAVADFEPSMVFWQEAEVGGTMREARTELTTTELWVQHDAPASQAGSYEALLAASPATDNTADVDPQSPLLAIYTAAFDGQPGAALLSHTSLLLHAMLNSQGQQTSENSSYMVSGPMFHVGVLMGTLATFLSGGRCVFVARPDAKDILEAIQSERVTHGFLVMPTIEQMRELNADGRYDVSSLFAKPDFSDYRIPLVMPATAPIMKNMACYGQTEVGGMAILGWLGGGGAGRPAPFIQVKIVDEEGREVPAGATGEIVIRGPLVMCGYHNRDAENARRTRDGWHRTNDLGRRNPDGSLVFVGPRTTMLKSGIENIYPAEVEACLRSHPDVADVCVIGVPDPTWQQNVKAIVVPKPGTALGAETLIEHCRDRIASYKKPKLVTFVDSLPRNNAGQLDRAAIDAAHGGGGYPRSG